MPGWPKTPEDRQRDSQRYGATWRKARLACLRRANWRCEIHGDQCQGAAAEVDHIIGAANDPNHRMLRAACHRCHQQVTSQQGNEARKRQGPRDPPAVQRTLW